MANTRAQVSIAIEGGADGRTQAGAASARRHDHRFDMRLRLRIFLEGPLR